MKPITEYTPCKLHPGGFDMEAFIHRGEVFIDDQCTGTPLIRAAMTDGYMVDWKRLDAIFQSFGIYDVTE